MRFSLNGGELECFSTAAPVVSVTYGLRLNFWTPISQALSSHIGEIVNQNATSSLLELVQGLTFVSVTQV